MLVSGRQTAAAVNHDDRGVGFLQRLDGLLDHGLVDAFLTTRNAAGIDDQVGNRAELAETVLAVAGEARVVGNERITRTREAIEQRGLAYVRPAD